MWTGSLTRSSDSLFAPASVASRHTPRLSCRERPSLVTFLLNSSRGRMLPTTSPFTLLHSYQWHMPSKMYHRSNNDIASPHFVRGSQADGWTGIELITGVLPMFRPQRIYRQPCQDLQSPRGEPFSFAGFLCAPVQIKPCQCSSTQRWGTVHLTCKKPGAGVSEEPRQDSF